MADNEHDSAFRRLKVALLEQDRLGERYQTAIGTSTELGAYARLCAAGEQVTAREAWLHWVDDEHFRGLNAGPFSILAEDWEGSPTAGALLTVTPDRRGP